MKGVVVWKNAGKKESSNVRMWISEAGAIAPSGPKWRTGEARSAWRRNDDFRQDSVSSSFRPRK